MTLKYIFIASDHHHYKMQTLSTDGYICTADKFFSDDL